MEIRTSKGTALPLLSLKGKWYLEAKWRIVWFREEHPDWSIETEIKINKGESLAKATIKDDKHRTIATAHKHETEQNFQDHIEKSETGAVARALGFIGFGTANSLEFEEGNSPDHQPRIADSPVTRNNEKAIPNYAANIPSSNTDYLIDFGKYQGKKLSEVPLRNLEFIKQKFTEDKSKRPAGKAKRFIDELDKYTSGNKEAVLFDSEPPFILTPPTEEQAPWPEDAPSEEPPF